MKKILFLFILLLPSMVLASVISLDKEDFYNKDDAGGFKVYYKDSNNEYNYYDTLYFDKHISKKEFTVSEEIYGIKIEKINGYDLSIDEITINGITDENYKTKLIKTDYDVLKVENGLEINIKGKGTLVISGSTKNSEKVLGKKKNNTEVENPKTNNGYQFIIIVIVLYYISLFLLLRFYRKAKSFR